MVTIQEAKNYLRIPYDDDNRLIGQIIDAGYDYLRDAIDDFDLLITGNANFRRKADYFVLMHWLPLGYDQREGMTSGEPALNYAARSLLMQLQLYRYKGGETK